MVPENKVKKDDKKYAMADVESVVSAGECTGMLPAMTEDDDALCRMMHVHAQPRRGKKPQGLDEM